jgi:hypothetical protein
MRWHGTKRSGTNGAGKKASSGKRARYFKFCLQPRDKILELVQLDARHMGRPPGSNIFSLIVPHKINLGHPAVENRRT